ncbi:unnamed protein product [Aphanomyces euteiches]
MKLSILAACLAGCAASVPQLHGLKPEVQAQVAAAASLNCDSGTKNIPIASVNDDYCDCRDGSDEPGTAACSHTQVQFYCENKGFFPSEIPTSRVNDGICDCCDGSDEYNSGASCPQTCATLRADHDKEKAAQDAVLEAGREARLKIVTTSKLQKEEQYRRRTDLEVEKARLDKAVEDARALKVSEEAIEVQEQKAAAVATRKKVAVHLGLHDLSSEQLIELVLDLSVKVPLRSDVLSAIRGVQTSDASVIDQQEQAYKLTLAAHKKEVERVNQVNDDLKKAKEDARKLKEDAGETFEEENDDKYKPLEVPTPPERPIDQLFGKLTSDQSVPRPETKAAREALDSAESKARETQSELDAIEKKLQLQYGPDDVLFSLRDTCVEVKSGEYTYKMCWFGQAHQDHTSLGKMEPIGPSPRLNRIKFSGGAKCWNGPERSLTVTLTCGETQELGGIEEPSTCVYVATLQTPIACSPEATTAPTSTPSHDEL